MLLASSCLILSSLIILLSTRASSPSNFNMGLGVTASRTKWLSQCGQYSSDSSNSSACFRKTLRHFLHAKVYIGEFVSESILSKVRYTKGRAGRKYHFCLLLEGMLLCLRVAFRTVKPLSAFELISTVCLSASTISYSMESELRPGR